MPLTGTFERSLDDKHRLALPKPFRDQILSDTETTLYAAPGNDRCIALYSAKSFQELADRLTKLSSAQSDVRNYLRMFYSQAECLEPDKQGRIRLPARLVAFAGLESQTTLVGVRDHAEIWETTRWESLLASHADEFDSLTTAAMQALEKQ
ncbi:division/cell wall cluster transcriptional repressor MraZ [Rubinisphaera italica]|uniref:Transcriptional regulator MraZ n=1 Tax=Rubinisphaera italica TaxID=2527969 RepID=A0A5C5XC28_9PLAN|nr:division/cell wall cluster transcriptional repressor MraZ [Rubinisphaera italica]TWT59853.1 Transcriptional regulator MraZ [Rubinisphaera italica]